MRQASWPLLYPAVDLEVGGNVVEALPAPEVAALAGRMPRPAMPAPAELGREGGEVDDCLRLPAHENVYHWYHRLLAATGRLRAPRARARHDPPPQLSGINPLV